MKISNAYVNLLRYVSASGKRTVLETFPNALKNGTKLTYAAPAQYKSVPLGMPSEIKGFNYAWWENAVLKQKGTRSTALEDWFKIITRLKL